ncbi:hypothetical protein BD410DRAFT_55479 [Rickenella mellea]|uniref:F-box domain-containing protein n=1 Tax=Rickenella mellea TaxID=50990 RepID=A0A4R5XI71_9AGAM|nr:hypothetical protein BD410DRAFT_55479 [Rickenella mellea]
MVASDTGKPSGDFTMFAGKTSYPSPVSLETIDYLIAALYRLKESKGVSDNEDFSLFASPGDCDSTHPPIRSEEVDFVSAYTRLRDLKKSGGALSTVLQAVEHEIWLQQQKCNPLALRTGIKSLLKDVLRHILEIGYETFEDPQKHHTFPIAVSGISQYFRSVALATPRIWNRINSSYCIEHLETFIMRSKAVDLSVVVGAIPGVSPSQNRCSVEEFMAIATKHSARWSKFEYHSDGSLLVEGNGYIHPSLYSYPTLYLPHLSELTCCKYHYDPRFDDINHAPFFSGWDMPNLTHFYGLNTMLDWRVNKAPLLQHGDIIIDPSIEVAWSWHWRFRSFLHFAPQLSNLELGLSNVAWSDNETELPVTVLPQLTKLAITIDGVVATKLVTEFFKAIKTPLILTLVLKFSNADVDQTRTDANSMLRAILENSKPRVSFELDAMEHSSPFHDVLQLLTSKLPSIGVLILRGSCIHSSSSDWITREDPLQLQTVILERCDGLEYYVVEKFAELVKARPQWDNFRLFHLDCQSLQPFIDELKESFGHRLLDQFGALKYLQQMKLLPL